MDFKKWLLIREVIELPEFDKTLLNRTFNSFVSEMEQNREATIRALRIGIEMAFANVQLVLPILRSEEELYNLAIECNQLIVNWLSTLSPNLLSSLENIYTRLTNAYDQEMGEQSYIYYGLRYSLTAYRHVTLAITDTINFNINGAVYNCSITSQDVESAFYYWGQTNRNSPAYTTKQIIDGIKIEFIQNMNSPHLNINQDLGNLLRKICEKKDELLRIDEIEFILLYMTDELEVKIIEPIGNNRFRLLMNRINPSYIGHNNSNIEGTIPEIAEIIENIPRVNRRLKSIICSI